MLDIDINLCIYRQEQFEIFHRHIVTQAARPALQVPVQCLLNCYFLWIHQILCVECSTLHIGGYCRLHILVDPNS